ncbi:MAG TPA: hypothetical protein VFA26_26215 [Gemmataceae bacterium]|nr:hypothetical protein [Gemmataceae bacterium]
MPITTACPNCQATVKAPDDMAGKKARCPKCQGVFVMPGSAPISSRPVPPPRPRPTDDLDEVPPDELPRRPSRRRERDDLDDRDDDLPRRPAPPPESDRSGTALGLGIGSLATGVIALMSAVGVSALCFCCPISGWVTLPVSITGAILGGAGVIVALATGKRGLAFPIAGTAVNVVAIALAIILPLVGFSLFTAANSQAMNQMQQNAIQVQKQAAEQQRRQIEDMQKKQQEEANAVWADVGKRETQKANDVEVRVTSAKVEEVPIGAGRLKSKRLVVRLELTSRKPAGEVTYRGWGSGDVFSQRDVKLTDNQGAPLLMVDNGPRRRVEGQVGTVNLQPNQPVTDVLHFTQPLRQFDFLRLELPAGNVGGTGKLRFQIPKAMVEGADQP